MEIESNGQSIPYLDDCGNQNGWTWVDEGAVAELCETYCDPFVDGAASITVVYGCP